MLSILLKVKIQAIYYQTTDNKLGIEHATNSKRITLAEAEEILSEREINFEEVLKVKYENIELVIPIKYYKNYII